MADARLRCLIIEDEPLIAMVLEDMIETVGHAVAGIASNAAAAMAAIEKGGFDVAILDVNLGADIAWDIADQLHDKGCAFILATGSSLAAAPQRFKSAHFLSKPYLLADVEAVLKRVSGD